MHSHNQKNLINFHVDHLLKNKDKNSTTLITEWGEKLSQSLIKPDSLLQCRPVPSLKDLKTEVYS